MGTAAMSMVHQAGAGGRREWAAGRLQPARRAPPPGPLPRPPPRLTMTPPPASSAAAAAPPFHLPGVKSSGRCTAKVRYALLPTRLAPMPDSSVPLGAAKMRVRLASSRLYALR